MEGWRMHKEKWAAAWPGSSVFQGEAAGRAGFGRTRRRGICRVCLWGGAEDLRRKAAWQAWRVFWHLI